jgi:DNA-binding MurR/RpiR family transcriptional regulator
MQKKYILETEKSFPSLTKGLKKVAGILLDDPIIFAIHPAKKIGEIIGVSETMVIRFCKAIGYEFSNLQEEIRNDLVNVDFYYKDNNNINDCFENLNNDINLVKNNLLKVNYEKIKEAAAMIMESNKIIVAGYYQSFTYAYWLYYHLNYILGNTVLYRPETDSRIIINSPENSCLVVFSFFRYATDPIYLAKSAKEKDLHVIVVTDSAVSPITEFADTVIVINLGNRFSFFRIGMVALSVTNMILYEISDKVKPEDPNFDSYHFVIKEGR